MQRTSLRSPLTLRLCSGHQLRGPRLMQFQPDSSGPAGSALRTTGEPRRGRCKKNTGADSSVFSRAFGRAMSRLATLMSSNPAPHRFAHRAAPLEAARSSRVQARSFASGSIEVSSPARPSSAHAPGRSSAGFLPVLVEPSAIVTSMNAPAAARVAAGDSPVGLTHAPRRPHTCHRVRFTIVTRAHNPACSGLRFAALARR